MIASSRISSFAVLLVTAALLAGCGGSDSPKTPATAKKAAPQGATAATEKTAASSKGAPAEACAAVDKLGAEIAKVKAIKVTEAADTVDVASQMSDVNLAFQQLSQVVISLPNDIQDPWIAAGDKVGAEIITATRAIGDASGSKDPAAGSNAAVKSLEKSFKSNYGDLGCG